MSGFNPTFVDSAFDALYDFFSKRRRHFRSSDIARIRLRGIVAVDRAAVPCGRWVKVASETPPDLAFAFALTGASIDPRAVYRYEVRR